MCVAVSFIAVAGAHAQTQEEAEFFESKIRPIFAEKCSVCHGEEMQMAELQLNTAKGFFKGANSGPVVVPGDPAASRLIQAVSYQERIKMPPTGKLPGEQIEVLTEWVRMGAPWPNAELEKAQVSDPAKKVEPDRNQTEHWAFQPVRDHEPPKVGNKGWVQNPIDNFILAKLEEKGLKPAPAANRLTLLRRVKFDLHGLPPTEPEIEEFLSDTARGAFARLIDRLLASPRYGERWGRHWLDVARYADSTGLDEDLPYPSSWRYRDYVIEAFNRDLPYDQFIREQIAGDLIPAEKHGEVNVQGIVATGFLALGPRALAQIDKMRLTYDVIDEQIDTLSKTFMGLTVSCARCHDHKFDPITTKDYYSLVSIFASTRNFEDIKPLVSKLHFEPLVSKEVYGTYEDHQENIKEKGLEIDAIVEMEVVRDAAQRLYPRLPDYMVAAWNVYQQGSTLGDTARQEGLDEKILEAWVDYLKPGMEFRPYLEKWHQANGSSVRALAEEYRKTFEASALPWNDKLREWAKELDMAVRDGKNLPDKPKFISKSAIRPEDRFFLEVSNSKDGRAEKHTAPFALTKEERDSILTGESKESASLLRRELEELKKASPPAPPMACAVVEGEMVDQRVFIRGAHSNPGEVVPKQFPVVLAGARQTPVTRGSGRKELGEWLTRPSHLLTSRVMVNRIWQWHFGEGLVRTPNNFGTAGESPTHPALLDYLAQRFVESGWSLKNIHRLILSSSTYQMSSLADEEVRGADPENRLLNRFDARKLSVEEMRDVLLALDGSLDLKMGGTLWPIRDEWGGGRPPLIKPEEVRRRTVYLPIIRNQMPSVLRLFDFADSATSSGRRNRSNTAPQALFMMNSGFLRERSLSFAKFLLADGRYDSDSQRIERAYWISLTRKPEPDELEFGLSYIANYPSNEAADSNPRLDAWQSFARMLMVSNEFHYVQ
jgi:hypothetical protein